MNKADLQIFLGETVVKSKLSKEAKNQMLNFIEKEADEHQLMVLALDGKIIKVEEDTKQIIEDRFNISTVAEACANHKKKSMKR